MIRTLSSTSCFLGSETSVVESEGNHLSVVHVGGRALRVPLLGVSVEDSPDVHHVLCFDLGCLDFSCFEALCHGQNPTLLPRSCQQTCSSHGQIRTTRPGLELPKPGGLDKYHGPVYTAFNNKVVREKEVM